MQFRNLMLLPVTSFALSGAAAWADADSDFAERCAGQGVVWCVGFDSQEETNAVGQVRYPDMSGAGSIAANPQAYPNNVAPNGFLYPAVDSGQAASGGGSLRLTANPVASANQSGGWYLGSAGHSPWPETFQAGETVYVQWRQRYDATYTNNVDWKAVGGDGIKQIILWRDESSCSDLQVVVVDSASRGYPQAYTNCGGRPLYQCPEGATGANCSSYNTNYLPLAGHLQYLYQYGPGSGDFQCMRNLESAESCGYWKDRHDTWWTYYLEIQVGASGQMSSHIKGWLARGNGEPLRQFIDFGRFPWSYNDSTSSIQNLLFTLYKTGKSSANHPAATSWYDELIVSTRPIPAPADVGSTSCGGSTADLATPCPPEHFAVQ